MTGINVTVDGFTLDTVVREFDDNEYGHTRATIGDLVVAQIVERLASEDRGAWRGYGERVANIRDEVIREKITPQIEEALAGPIRKTNTYGEATGQETTLRELIMDEARRIMTKPIDSGYRSNGQTFLQKIVADAVKTELETVAKEAVTQVRAEFAAQAGQAVTDAVTKALRSR